MLWQQAAAPKKLVRSSPPSHVPTLLIVANFRASFAYLLSNRLKIYFNFENADFLLAFLLLFVTANASLNLFCCGKRVQSAFFSLRTRAPAFTMCAFLWQQQRAFAGRRAPLERREGGSDKVRARVRWHMRRKTGAAAMFCKQAAVVAIFGRACREASRRSVCKCARTNHFPNASAFCSGDGESPRLVYVHRRLDRRLFVAVNKRFGTRTQLPNLSPILQQGLTRKIAAQSCGFFAAGQPLLRAHILQKVRR